MSAFFELHPLAWINRDTIYIHGPVDVRTRGSPGGTDVTDNITRGHMLTFFGLKSGHVQIDGFNALAMIDGDRAATQVPLLNNFDNAGSDGMNRRAGRAELVDAGVKIARQFSVM